VNTPGEPRHVFAIRATLALLGAATALAAATGCKDDAARTTASGAAPVASASSMASATSVASAAPSVSAATPAAPPAPDGMLYVAPASFDAVVGDGKVVRADVHGFFIDKEKVTNGAFKKCYDDRACVVSAGSLDFLKSNLADGPVTGMSQSEARAYCKSVGKRLPTAAEWELAARGSEGRTYPWGNEEPADCVAPSCKPVRVQTPEGLVGMAGMLWEMSDADVCFVKAARPELCTQKAPVIHGGAWNTSATSFKVLEVHNASGVPYSTVSFRCVKDAA
jgi:formylglycine-generating enzyme required for sulfatase activity